MDSSVIFLVVLGLWAAYLVPHWLRRREDLSASRSVDRFSAAMRVLSRRPAPEELPDRPRATPFVLAPVREPAALTAGPDHGGDGTDGWADPVEQDLAPALLSGRRPRRVLARTLAALLLVSLLAVPVLGVLSVLGLAPVWAAAPAAALVVVLVAALRASARRRRRAVRTTVPAHAVTVLAPDDAVTTTAATAVVRAEEPSADEREELFDEEAHTAREEQARIRRLAEEALRAADVPYREPEPGEWTPVAVPLPAYLLKPHARPAWQPAPQQAAPAARTRVAVDVDEDDIPTYAPPVRRVAGA